MFCAYGPTFTAGPVAVVQTMCPSGYRLVLPPWNPGIFETIRLNLVCDSHRRQHFAEIFDRIQQREQVHIDDLVRYGFLSMHPNGHECCYCRDGLRDQRLMF